MPAIPSLSSSTNYADKIWCGPYALSYITEDPPETINTLINTFRGSPDNYEVKTTYWKEMELILRTYGFTFTPHAIPFNLDRIGIKTLFTSYNSLSDIIRTRLCIARVGNHIIVIDKGRLICRVTQKLCNYTHPEYSRKMITHLAVLTPNS